MTLDSSDGTRNGARVRMQMEAIAGFLEVSRGNFIIEPTASVILAGALWQYSDARQIGLWLVLVWVGAALRALLSLHIYRTDPPEEILQEWGIAMLVATCLSGGLWASGLFFLWPLDAGSTEFILIVAIMAVAGGVMVSVAAYTPAISLYLPVTCLVALVCLTMQLPENNGVSIIVLSVTALMLATLGWRTNRMYAKQGRLRLELEAAHKAANAANHTRSEFVRNISDELRKPLNEINGFSEIIKDQTFGPINNEHYLKYANDIHNSGTRLLEVINDILDLSHFETGSMTLNEESVNLLELVRSVVDAMQERADKAGVALRTKLPDVPVRMLADPRLLKQILSNLVSNSVKFTPLGGEVEVEVKFAPNDDLELIVNDNGIGMSPEDLATALTPFGQIDASVTRRVEGTGLGVTLVKSLVELHGGKFRLRSELTVGTRAVATFPASCVQ